MSMIFSLPMYIKFVGDDYRAPYPLMDKIALLILLLTKPTFLILTKKLTTFF